MATSLQPQPRPQPTPGAERVGGLPAADRLLPLWIGLAMASGLLLGRTVPRLDDALDAVKVGQTSLPIALGLLLMMYPVLAKVRYDEVRLITADRRMMAASLIFNWVLGPLVMFGLAWLLLPHQPAYRTGVILVGLARCIAMVLIWTDLAQGDREMAAVLVALNAVFQVLFYAVLGLFYLKVLPGWLDLDTRDLDVSIGTIARTVGLFLGIPLVAGYLSRRLGERRHGRAWYEQRFLPRIAPVALYGLLFTVVVLFALQGDTITTEPLDVARIALPLLAYFAIMWIGAFWVSRRLHLTYPRAASLSFSAASNDFELAIAVAIGVFGVTSGEALAGVVGPLIEVPVLVGLVYVALWLRRRLTWPSPPCWAAGPRPTGTLTDTRGRVDGRSDVASSLALGTSECQPDLNRRTTVPTYQYACTACDHRFDAVQSFSDDALTECPECGGRLRKLYGAVGVVFKGSGFYRTDSRSDAKGAGKGGEKKTESKPAETTSSPSSSSSESKPTAKPDAKPSGTKATSSSSGSAA